MATIEKLIKAFEALKVFQPGGGTSDDSKKREQSVSKKDKIMNCNIVADCICAPNMRAIIDFPKFLGIAMETFLNLCDDAESDVRMVADECINRSIKVLLETNLGRLQVELYKEIKKNGSSRTLRAALWRFAEMAPLIRPQKCRPYMVNMLPCLARICKREEEAVQETLLSSMVKICPALMVFANESEIKALLKSFLPNLKSPSASCRRTAATSLVLICQYSRSPTSFYNYLLNVLLDMVLPVDGDQNLHTLMGVVLCMRSLVPHLGEASLVEQGLKGSFGVMTKEKIESVSKEQLIKVIQMLLHLMTHRDHNVVTAALEAFIQLLRNPNPLLVSILTVPGTITRTLVYLADQASSPSNDSLQEVPSFSKLAEESAGLEDDADIPDPVSDPAGDASSAEGSAYVYNTFVARGESGAGSEDTSPVDTQVIVTTTDSEYSGIEIGDLNEEKSEKSNMTQVCSSSQETLLSIQSISPTRKPSLQKGVSQDLNGNPEIEDTFEGDRSLLPSPGEDVSVSIGSLIDRQPAIVYCIRFIASRFLLSGCKRVLKPDKAVRVSVKSLALTCVSSAVAMYPQVFLLNLFTDVSQDLDQEIQDVLLFANHHDPQLKGNTTQIAANLIMSALKESRGNFTKWLSDFPGKVVDLSIQSLVDIILDIVKDSSSVAIRLAIISLQTCINPLLQSIHSELALLVLLRLMEVKDNPYWLVKTELLDLLSGINFKILVHLESCCTLAQRGQHHFLGKLNLQHRVIHNVIIPLLGNEDHRVRHSAAQTLVKLIPHLFFAADHCQQDPVIAIAKDHTGRLLTPDPLSDSPPLVQGLVKPFHFGAEHVSNVHIESNLSRVIMALLHELNLSNVKHNTYGCCHALCLLSDCFPATQYAHSWGCGPPTPLVPRDSTNRMVMRRPPSRSLSGSSTFSLDEMSGGSGGGPLTIMLSLLTSSLVSLDLTAHHDTLKLAGNLVSGAAYKCLRSVDNYNLADSSEDTKWQGISDRVLYPLIEQFLTHIARLLNACCHVIDEQLPGPPQIKPSLPSLPTAPSLSPIKRKAKGEKDGSSAPGTPGSSEKSTPKQQKDKDKEPERERNKKDGLGTFYSLPQYMKLYEVLRGAYSTYKISLDLGTTDKFCVLLKCTLECLAQVLEIASLQDIGKYAEELLGYLRTTVSLEPTCTILCVQQLLKALFGTNLVSQWEPQQAINVSHKPGKATRLTSNTRPGLYSHCFTQPYSHFTQSLAAATFKATAQTEQEETTSILNWLKKCVERKLPAILKPGSKTDKAAIAAYIRLFEPLVIKALKQYTVTSCLELQRQVLDLLSQLIQLRVNYCLLDSDQVFIGFIIKQIDFIEEGQIRNSDSLIPNLFNFLVMLSYEKYHSKSIIGMPKIIQLCDGIMASGLHPTTHAIPALKPIVYDLFLLRAANKSDISRELETQREVVVSMLLRLIQYHETLDLLVIVLQQCHKESEERWKKLSRQVTDTILPSLARQQVTIDSMAALETLHRLFESLAPIVFRPVDILLKTLLQEPMDVACVENLQRWVSLVLSVLRVLMAQSKEEVILSRMQELGLGLNVFKVPSREMTTEERDLALTLSPEEVLAWFLIQVIGNCASYISQKCELTGLSSSSTFLTQQLSQLLLYVTHMFQSGLFRKVATSAMKASHLDTPHCYHSIQELNHMFLSVSMTLPTLTLQWCNILILLNFDDQTLWSTVMQTPKRFLKPGKSHSADLEVQVSPMTHCCNLEILRRGGLVLFCDYVCENLTEAEHMTWLVINHVSDIIALSQESPVQDFVSAIHRNSSASSLFIQAIHARCENVSKPSLVRKTMKCLEAIHLSQTGSLLTLLIDKFLNTHHLAVARICDSIACKRVEMLLADSVQDAFKQLPLEDLTKLLKYMESNKLTKRHARLVSLLQKLRMEIHPEETADIVGERPHPLSLPKSLSDININKECYVSIVKNQCFSADCNPSECAKLLHNLTYADILSITMTKEFNLCILPECILLGAHDTLIKNNDSTDILDSEGNKIPQEPMFDPLLQAAQLTLIRHVNNIINMLPTPHQVIKYGTDSKTAKRTRYLEKMDDFFSDTSWSDMVFMLVSSLNIYIQTLSTFPWQPEVPVESHCDIGQFCVLCAEMIDWMFHHDLLPTSKRLNSCLQCMSLILQHPQLSVVIGQKQHTSWVCALTGTAYQTVYSLMVVPGEKLVSTVTQNSGDHSKETLNDLIIKACDQVSELVEFSQHHLSGRSQVIPSFLQHNLRNIITGLGRQPVLNSYARTPSIVWKMGWIPSPNGEPKTKLPPLPVDFLEDKDVLREYVFRINSLGWINRQQFEETWMSLLSVVNPVTMPSNGEEMVVSPEEEMERAQCTVMAVRAITSLLIQSTLIPVPGNTSYSSYEIRPRDKPLGFLHTRCGKKLTVIRGVIEQEVHNLHCRRMVRSGCTGDEKDVLRYMFDSNLEREIMADDYTLGQIAIEAIWSIVGALDFHIAESDTTDSMESPTTDSPDTPGRSRQQFPLLSFERERRERSVNFSGLDIHSCLQFLLELYGQWMLTTPRPPLMLKNEVVKSIVCLSDLFMEREQYDWMQEVLLDLYKTHPQEDEILMQYLNVGICKAAAVVGMDNATTEKLMKIIDAGFRSPHLPSRIGALHGTLYLLEAGIQDVTKLLVPLATDFLLRNLSAVSQTCITSQNYMLTMWSTAFYIMENYHIDLKDLEFPSKVLQLAVITASGSEDSVSTAVYLAILKGLERLLLTDVLSKQDAEAIIKLGVDRLCLPSPQRSLAALGLMFTCMYSGKQYDQYSPSPRDAEPGTTAYDFEVVYQDPESLILAMERVTVLFDRIKKGYPYEARVISRVLPTFLADFFPPQDVMNKVIGEFISSQQPYPQVVAKVVFQVFANLHQQKQQALVRDWVMLSLSNFTQRTPIAMAMWSLTCFFISASVNPWLRALFNHVIGRMGRMDIVDRRLFCITAMDFYNQLVDESQRRAFTSTFMAVSQPGIVYQELLQHINSLPKS
ncbi:huntingtin-like [Ylistrum balloti]|uniref:huntingtin-like n=1 Tax=Ylistrum balloti TaxID=509963 RepID=UPI002905C039|nr:huntingtin-like [Ylistrum balloti]